MPLCLLGHNSDSRGIQYTEVWIQKIQGGDGSRDQGSEGKKSMNSSSSTVIIFKYDFWYPICTLYMYM